MANKESQTSYYTDTYRHSPDREILTPEGCRTLLQVGEKSLTKLIKHGLPHIRVSNSHRFVRRRVIEWMANEGEKLSVREQDSLFTETDPSVSGGG